MTYNCTIDRYKDKYYVNGYAKIDSNETIDKVNENHFDTANAAYLIIMKISTIVGGRGVLPL